MVLINAGVKYIENKRTFEEKLRLGQVRLVNWLSNKNKDNKSSVWI